MERGFDLACLFTNPDLDQPAPPVAIIPDLFRRRVAVVAEAANLDRRQLLQQVLAWCGLSAAWSLSDGNTADAALAVAADAAAEHDGLGTNLPERRECEAGV